MQTILLLGTDAALLASRAAVLSRTGNRTVWATMPDAMTTLAEQGPSLVVLCHTLSEATCRATIRAIRERWPETRILHVLPLRDEGGEQCPGLADGVTESRPECLLREAKTLLGQVAPVPVDISSWKGGDRYRLNAGGRGEVWNRFRNVPVTTDHVNAPPQEPPQLARLR